MSDLKAKRDGFATKLGVLCATLGSAVGLGNIWKFPYMTGENGGAGFLMVYILSTLFVGLPIMVSEIMLGRVGRANAIATFKKLAPKGQPWYLVGVSGVVAAFLIMAFYSDVVGWIFAYIIKAVSGEISTTDPQVSTKAFADLVGSPWTSLIWQWVVIILVGAIIVRGAARGIEKTTKILLPVLFVMLLAICVRSLTLPKAMDGLKFLFNPDFSKITADVVLMAMGLAFFKLSLGMGTMLTYGSYFRSDASITGTVLRVMLADLTVSIMAGVAVFPVVFNFGFEPASGPGLLFMTIPAVFSSMPGGQIFMTLFFVLTGIATIGAMLSLLEVPVAFLVETLKGLDRRRATVISCILIAAIGSLATLSMSTLADVKIFGLDFFNLFDFLSSNVLLPIGGICIAVFVGWIWGYAKTKDHLTNQGTLNNQGLVTFFFTMAKFVSPVLVAIVLLNGLHIFG